jgi:hypothetical protein
MDTYRATNTTNGKFYIGSTTNFERRRAEHLNSKRSLPFQNALRKNPDAFEWEVWSDDSDEPILEQALLDMWHGKECCYNLNPLADRLDSESQRRGGLTQGKKNVEDRVGFLSQDWVSSESYLEHQSEAGKIGGSKIVDSKVGIHSEEFLNSSARRERDSKGAKVLNAQQWVSTRDGFRGNAGNVARHNKINGWDPSDRVKLE